LYLVPRAAIRAFDDVFNPMGGFVIKHPHRQPTLVKVIEHGAGVWDRHFSQLAGFVFWVPQGVEFVLHFVSIATKDVTAPATVPNWVPGGAVRADDFLVDVDDFVVDALVDNRAVFRWLLVHAHTVFIAHQHVSHLFKRASLGTLGWNEGGRA